MLEDVLKILENNSRATPQQISVMTKTPVAEVAQLIMQAEKEHIILKYKALINWDKAGGSEVWALIGVKLRPQKDVGFDSIAEQVCRYPQARTVYLISGMFDLIVLVVGKTNHEIADFVSHRLATIGGVQETVTQFLLKRYKEDGEIINGRDEARRQPVVF